MLVLAVGDALVAGRAGDIPAKFRRLLVPEKIEGVLCTGNLSSKEMHDYFRSLSSDLHVSRGARGRREWTRAGLNECKGLCEWL
eukprot:502485-Hanusia_phi.AAC.1